MSNSSRVYHEDVKDYGRKQPEGIWHGESRKGQLVAAESDCPQCPDLHFGDKTKGSLIEL